MPSCVNTKPFSLFAVPCSTKVNVPPVISEAASASPALVNTNGFEPSPVAVTV